MPSSSGDRRCGNARCAAVPAPRRTLTAVVELGGKILVAHTEIPTMGSYAMFADPDGVAVGVLQPLRR